MKTIETNVLLQMYANARITSALCGGHHKGNMNDGLYNRYALELESRGITVPKDIHNRIDKSFVYNVEIPEGIFNGKGSY
jgi:hypothetical protein